MNQESYPLLGDWECQFLAIDTTGDYAPGEPQRWVAKLKIRHQIHDRPDYRTVKLEVTPPAKIQYTTDGTSPRNGRVYDGTFSISDGQVILQVYATAADAVAQETFTIGEKGVKRAHIDEALPAKLKEQRTRFDSTNTVFELISKFKDRQGVFFHGVTLNVGEGEQAVQVRFNDRVVTLDVLEKVIAALRQNLDEPDALVQLTIRDGANFDTGFDLKTFAEMANIELTPDKVEQSDG